MIIKSFIKDYFGLKPVDVEVVFTTGLPQISILGLPDKVIQESAKRIQSALIAQGYQMPKAKHVLVNLWPREMRKTSLGIDLAIALGILAESGQKNIYDGHLSPIVYGELTLSGNVRAPKDIEAVSQQYGPVITGGPVRSYPFPVSILENLRSEYIFSQPVDTQTVFAKPSFRYQKYPKDVAGLISIVALGEHPLLLAGPPGTGKTALAESVSAFLAEPDEDIFLDCRNIARYFGESLHWRPMVSPHHTTPAISMLGGGVPPKPGQIVRAHGGVLILDELLEFDQKVQSALRETLETGRVSVSRGLQSEDFDAQFLTIATTNLCRCGEFVPQVQNKCRCTRTQLRNYFDKLSGPFTDRMSILHFTHNWSSSSVGVPKEYVSAEEMCRKLQEVRLFVKGQGRGAHGPMSVEDIIGTLEKSSLAFCYEIFRSHRRKLAFWRVARTIADLDMSEKICEIHLNQSYQLTIKNFSQLKSLDI